MKKILRLILILILCSPLWAVGQDGAFTASVSSNTVAIDEQFQISFTLNVAGKSFQPPSFNDFMVLSGPNQSQSMQFVNGTMSQSLSFTYYLQPKAAGTFKIGSASVQTGSKTLKTNPITITVGKGSNTAQSNGKEESISAQIAKNIFIKAIVNKTNVYRGEGISVTYKLCTRVDIVDFNLNKMPTLDGFWSQDLEGAKELKLHPETINGVEYNVAEIKKTILFPQRAGTLQLDKMEAQAVVRVRAKRQARNSDPFGDFFDDPFFGGNVQDIKHTVTSEPIKILVKPLPDNAPPSFSGAVGNFTMQAFLDKTTTKANEPVTLKIKISGKGNLKLIDPITLELPPDIETFDPKTNDNISVTVDGVSGTRTLEYLLIPRRAGTYKINALNFSFFNLSKNKYETLQSNEFELKVDKGNASEATASMEGTAKADLQLIGNDIRYINTSNLSVQPEGDFFFGSKSFYAFLLATVLMYIGFLFVNKKQEKDASDTTGLKSRKATKIAKAKLAGAAKLLKQNNHNKVYEEILRALWGYVSDKYNIAAADLNKDNVRAIFASKNKSEETVNAFLGVIDDCEFARYSPSASIANAAEVYEKSIAVITKIEQ